MLFSVCVGVGDPVVGERHLQGVSGHGCRVPGSVVRAQHHQQLGELLAMDDVAEPRTARKPADECNGFRPPAGFSPAVR